MPEELAVGPALRALFRQLGTKARLAGPLLTVKTVAQSQIGVSFR
jgi:hypothetical protein